MRRSQNPQCHGAHLGINLHVTPFRLKLSNSIKKVLGRSYISLLDLQTIVVEVESSMIGH